MVEVTVVIPTYNRPQLVCSTVLQVRDQSVQDFELWVIDQSDAGCRFAIERFIREMADDRIHYLHLPQKGHPNARNEGIARATAPILLFLDDDVILLDDDFL